MAKSKGSAGRSMRGGNLRGSSPGWFVDDMNDVGTGAMGRAFMITPDGRYIDVSRADPIGGYHLIVARKLARANKWESAGGEGDQALEEMRNRGFMDGRLYTWGPETGSLFEVSMDLPNDRQFRMIRRASEQLAGRYRRVLIGWRDPDTGIGRSWEGTAEEYWEIGSMGEMIRSVR